MRGFEMVSEDEPTFTRGLPGEAMLPAVPGQPALPPLPKPKNADPKPKKKK